MQEVTKEKEEFEMHRKPAGFYVIDTNRLFKGKFEIYKLVSAISGVNSHIDNSKFGDIFSFLMDYNHIAMIPFPHLNKIELSGMAQKEDYTIWREKNNFFTDMDDEGYLRTWSMLTGAMLYYEA